jgi:hypothetical protein
MHILIYSNVPLNNPTHQPLFALKIKESQRFDKEKPTIRQVFPLMPVGSRRGLCSAEMSHHVQ